MRSGNRSIFKKVIASPFALVAVLILSGLLAKGTWSMHQKSLATKERLAEAEAGLIRLQSRQADLSSKVTYLSTDAGIEAEVRTKYRGLKEGESVAVIVDDSKQTASAVNASSTPPTPTGWWGRLLHWVGF
jgi:hypothetical protein